MEHNQLDKITTSPEEQSRLGQHIYTNFLAADSTNQARIERFRRYYRMWRSLDVTPGTRTDGPDFQVPMLKWVTFGHWARVMAALLGDDAEIIAKPTAPIDQAIVKKVGTYMTWRWFEYMKATPELAAWTFRTAIFGRAHAYCPYEEETYLEGDKKGRNFKPVVSYSGPKLISLWPSDIILPAQEGVRDVNDFNWKIRRTIVTPQELIEGEEAGRYFGVKANWSAILAQAQQRQELDYWWDYEKIDSAIAQGVDYSTVMGSRDTLEMWEWYGKWRMPNSRRDVNTNSYRYRETEAADILVKYLPKVQLTIGAEDLKVLYPRMRKRTPFLDLSLIPDGSYWGPGLGEMIENLQLKETANYKLFERSGKFSVGPVIFYKPSSGFDPETFVYQPGMAVPTADPNAVKIFTMPANFEFTDKNHQLLNGMGEKVTGVSDQTLGQSIDRPNAPKTATGQMALIEQGNVRASLDMSTLRDGLSQAIEYTWQLDREFSDETVFFRVTGEDAGGLYDTDKGFGKMTAQEREHNFDFKLKFATSTWSKEAKKQEAIQMYQIAATNPLVIANPNALWGLLNMVWKALGYDDLGQILPEPPVMDLPKKPKDEWSLILRSEEVNVNPNDNDDEHIMDHRKRMERMLKAPKESQDPAALEQLTLHIQDHEEQKRQKMMLQMLAANIAKEVQAQGGGAPQGALPPGMEVPPGVPIEPPGAGVGPDAAVEAAGPGGLGGV